MLNGNPIAFRLPCNSPAFSAAKIDGEYFAVTDALEKVLYIISRCGRFTEAVPTARTYETITPMGDNGFFALERCRCRRFTNRVYMLNRSFEEIGCIELQTDDPCDVLADLYYEDDGAILAAFETSLRKYSLYGNEIKTVREGSPFSIFHVASGNTFTAMHHRSKWGDVVTIRTAQETVSGSVSGRLVLRDLLSGENGILYGLFGFRYQYNYLLPVFEGGKLCLPGEEELPGFLQNITHCS